MEVAELKKCIVCEDSSMEQLAVVTSENGSLCPMHYVSLLIFKSSKDNFGYSDEAALEWTQNILATMLMQMDNASNRALAELADEASKTKS